MPTASDGAQPSKPGKKLRDLLQTAIGKGERGAIAFLAKHPEIARWSFCSTGGHSTYVLKEFRFGSRFRADLVVVTSYSGAWEVHFVEMEPPDDPVINKDGTPSKRLNQAFSQIHDWNDYIRNYPAAIRDDLSQCCWKKDLLKIHTGRPCNYSGDYLDHQNTFVFWNFHIIIGDREKLSKDSRRRMNQYHNHGGISIGIGTYGRFFDIADNYDEHRADPLKSVTLNKIRDESRFFHP